MIFLHRLWSFSLFYISFRQIGHHVLKLGNYFMKKHNYWIKKRFFLNSTLLLIISLLLIAPKADASYTLRQFSSKNGLSNSAILSMCQDSHGVIWIGSCDGLNVYDGNYLGLYKQSSFRQSDR